MKKNWIDREVKIRAGVEKFYNHISSAENINELQNVMNDLLKIVYQCAPLENNRANKGLKVFEIYNAKNTSREQKVKEQINKRIQKSWQDYIPQFKLLRVRGYSWQKISDYALNKYNVKVSRETLRKVIQNV